MEAREAEGRPSKSMFGITGRAVVSAVVLGVLASGCDQGNGAHEAFAPSEASIWNTCDFTAGSRTEYREPAFVAQEAELRIFAIHEATTSLGDPATRRPDGQASVRVDRGVRTVLVLSAHEATHWTVESESGLERVILAGAGAHTLDAPAGVAVERAELGACGYGNEDVCDADALIAGAERHTGLALTGFVGCRFAAELAIADSE